MSSTQLNPAGQDLASLLQALDGEGDQPRQAQQQ
jgi:hypothetical protein